MSNLLQLVILAVCAAVAAAYDWHKTQILVVHDPALQPPTLDVDPATAEITHIDYDNSTAQLFANGEPLYHHVVYYPTGKRAVAAEGLVDKHALVEFFGQGGSVLAVSLASKSVPDGVKAFLNQAGIHPAPKGFALASHFAEHIALGAEDVKLEYVVGNVSVASYAGTAALLLNSEHVIPLVAAPALTFTASSKDTVLTTEKTWTSGTQGFVAAAVQGLNNARAAWVGLEQLVTPQLVQWVLGQRGVLRLQHVEHYKLDEPGVANRTMYRIRDKVTYVAGLSEYAGGKWVPYVPAGDDVVQLAFKMLDPYQRLNMSVLGPAASTEDGPLDMTLFHVDFAVPDHHGMYTFELDYKRAGYTYVEDRRVVTVRHLANDEYKRSWAITNSWLYVACAAIVLAVWMLFVAAFLHLGTPEPEQPEPKARVKDSKELREAKQAVAEAEAEKK